MINIEALIRSMVDPLIDYPESLTIEEVDTADFHEYRLHLHPDDVGRVIGRKGRVIRSIRTIIYSIRNKGEKRPRIVVEDGKDQSEDL